MCIAIGKPMGVDVPSESILSNCWRNNPDGAGFAFAIGGNVFIRKGYMTYDAFKSALDEVSNKYDLKKLGMLFHFRIATHGARDGSMTHPFPLHTDEGALKKLDYTTDYAIIHNGIIDLTSYKANKSNGLSDTALFIQKYLSKLASNPGWFDNKENTELIYDMIDSKMAILSGTGEIRFTEGFKEDNGVFYSNSSYDDNYVKRYIKSYHDYPYSYVAPSGVNSSYDDYSKSKYFSAMSIDKGYVIDGDMGTLYVDEDDLYYAVKNQAGIYDIYERYPVDNDDNKFSGYEFYFSDYEYIGSGEVYDDKVNPITWKCNVVIYEDQIFSEPIES